MQNIENDIKAVKQLIKKSYNNGFYLSNKPFEKYSKAYFSTNENIKGYLNYLDISLYENALSVLSSGDQMFNLICQDILNIDTFDINKISLYIVFGLKLTLIEKYDYEDYLKIVSTLINANTSLEELTSILESILPNMDKEYREFWSRIIEYNYELQKNNGKSLNLLHLICQNTSGFKKSLRGNLYLENAHYYQRLKNNLRNAHINFYNTDIMHLPIKKYQLLLLSNIISYYEVEYHKPLNKYEYQYLLNYLTNFIDDKGIILFNYLFDEEIYKWKDHLEILKDLGLESSSVNPLSYLHEMDIAILKRGK